MLHIEFKLRFSLTVLFVLALLLLAPSPFCAQSAERPIRVAARICPPFVMNEAGDFSGLSIFLFFIGAQDQHETLFDAGSLGAVVADGAVLKYMIKKAQAEGRYESLSVLPFEFEKQSYAFALPENSPYLEKFNQALLAVLEGPLWRKELVKYLGK